jgi:hypothetical protein
MEFDILGTTVRDSLLQVLVMCGIGHMRVAREETNTVPQPPSCHILTKTPHTFVTCETEQMMRDRKVGARD